VSVDRIEAQEIADLLGIMIPEDLESLTAALWEVVGLGAEPLPESVETRWAGIQLALLRGLGGMLGLL